MRGSDGRADHDQRDQRKLTNGAELGDEGEKTLRVMWPAPGDAEGLSGVIGSNHELVDAGGLSKLNGNGVGVFERRE